MTFVFRYFMATSNVPENEGIWHSFESPTVRADLGRRPLINN
jgi:hypothetical protein